ncbi:MAG: Required for respiratory growth protein 9 mitochondrial [Candelina submexicana]|nr:MAG: Required for respiratory growth protein 9 mitochondrial [Candelina submexicana]
MPCSACSTRSLGAFILDLTGLQVKATKTLRRVIGPPPPTRRFLSTQPPLRLRQSHQASIGSGPATSIAVGDNLYVPFEDSGISLGAASAGRRDHLQDTPTLPLKSHYLQAAASDRIDDSPPFSARFESANQILTDSETDIQAFTEIEPPKVLGQTPADHTAETIGYDDAVLELSAASIESLSAENRSDGSPYSSRAGFKEYGVLRPQYVRPMPTSEHSITRTGLKTTRPRGETPSKVREAEHWTPAKREQWQIQKASLSEKYKNEAWNPRKRLSPDALEGIRALNTQYPEMYTTPVLAAKFEVSPEVIRRILKSKWRPSDEEEVDRRRRWDKRGEKIWSQMVELGVKPPKKWRDMGIGKVEDGALRRRKRKPASALGSSGKGDRSWLYPAMASSGMGSGGPAPQFEPLGERIL